MPPKVWNKKHLYDAKKVMSLVSYLFHFIFHFTLHFEVTGCPVFPSEDAKYHRVLYHFFFIWMVSCHGPWYKDKPARMSSVVSLQIKPMKTYWVETFHQTRLLWQAQTTDQNPYTNLYKIRTNIYTKNVYTNLYENLYKNLYKKFILKSVQ